MQDGNSCTRGNHTSYGRENGTASLSHDKDEAQSRGLRALGEQLGSHRHARGEKGPKQEAHDAQRRRAGNHIGLQPKDELQGGAQDAVDEEHPLLAPAERRLGQQDPAQEQPSREARGHVAHGREVAAARRGEELDHPPAGRHGGAQLEEVKEAQQPDDFEPEEAAHLQHGSRGPFAGAVAFFRCWLLGRGNDNDAPSPKRVTKRRHDAGKIQGANAHEAKVHQPPALDTAAIDAGSSVGDARGGQGPDKGAEGVAGVDEAEPAVRDVAQPAHKGVGVAVLVGHAQGLEHKGCAELGEPPSGPQALGQQLQHGAESEELS